MKIIHEAKCTVLPPSPLGKSYSEDFFKRTSVLFTLAQSSRFLGPTPATRNGTR